MITVLLVRIFIIGSAIVALDRYCYLSAKQERYVFVENTERSVDLYQGNWLLAGKLNKNGDFILEYKFSRFGGSGRATPPNVINFPGKKPKKSYEFRSGVLIPGELQPDGRFVPEVGGKIILFKEYVYARDSARIWNLPGVFVTEAEAIKMKTRNTVDKK